MQKLLILILLLTIKPVLAKPILLTTQNSYTIKTQISSESVDATIKEIDKLHRRLGKGKPIYLVLKSPGGSIFAGNLLINFLKSLDREIKTISIYAASMGFQIVQSLGERLALKEGVLMAHPGSTRCEGNQYEIKPCLYRLKQFDNMLAKVAAERIGMKLKEYKDMIRYERWFMGTDLIGMNVIDRIVTIKCSKALLKKKLYIKTFGLFGETTEEVSACPLM